MRPPVYLASGLNLALLAQKVIDELPMGVVVLDVEGYILAYNRYEENLARRRREDVTGRHFFTDVARCTDVPCLSGAFEQSIGSNTLNVTVEHAFDLPFLPQRRDVEITLRSIDLAGEIYGLVLIQDRTHQKIAEQERDRLLNIFMHDLRNPLNAIIGFGEILQANGIADEAGKAAALAHITDAGVRMHKMVGATLDAARGRCEQKNQELNLAALVLSSLGAFLPEALRHGIALKYEGEFERVRFPERAIPVMGRVETLAAAIDNLLSNAIKYARGVVHVQIDESAAREVSLIVTDDGDGIAPEFLDRVFEEGFQPPGSKHGHGLGLFSVRRTADAHSGRVQISSEVGKGTSVRFTLPRA